MNQITSNYIHIKIFALKYENSDFHTIQENPFHEKYMSYKKNPKYTFQIYIYDLCVGETIITIYSLG